MITRSSVTRYSPVELAEREKQALQHNLPDSITVRWNAFHCGLDSKLCKAEIISLKDALKKLTDRTDDVKGLSYDFRLGRAYYHTELRVELLCDHQTVYKGDLKGWEGEHLWHHLFWLTSS